MRKNRTRSRRNVILSVPNGIVGTIILTLVVYVGYILFYIIRYNDLPSPKRDIRLKEIIVNDFQKDYDVIIKQGDLIGLGDKFYIAYGNKKFIRNAYSIERINKLQSDAEIDEVNRPVIKLFYVREPGILSVLLSVIPIGNIESQIAELSIKKYYEFSPIVATNHEDKTFAIVSKKFPHECSFPVTFSITNVMVADIDQDDRDEIVAEWLWFGGGSGGTKWSSILEVKDGKVEIGSGYPDMLNIEFSKYLWAILRYSGLLNPAFKDREKLEAIVERMSLTKTEKDVLLAYRSTEKDVLETLGRIARNADNQQDIFYFFNTVDEKGYVFHTRTTNDYCHFVKINERYVYIDAYYIYDKSCHWCKHYWRIMGFLYKEGRWISDRNINGQSFEGIWLDDRNGMTLNEIFGTYEDQGIMGIAWSFLNPDWTSTSEKGVSDPSGIEMRLESPVDKKIRAIYSGN